MKNSDEMYKEAGLTLGKALFENDNPQKSEYRILVSSLLMLLFVGAESVKVLFRSNFGKNAINIWMLISCFICLGGVSAYSFYCYFNPNEIETSGSETSFLITGLLFSFLSIYILGRGIILKHVAIKSKVQMDYSGDTNFLNILKKYGWKKEQIHLIAEPLIVLFIGFAYLFFNLIGGITIMVFAISVWARLLIEIIFLKNNVINKINTPSYNTIDRPKNHVS